VRAGHAFAVQAAREVGVDDVEAAGAELEIRSLGVNEDVVTRLAWPEQRDVTDRRARAAAGNVDDEALLAPVDRRGLDDLPPAQDEQLSALGQMVAEISHPARRAARR
jgi:hypothetical protein